MQTLQGVRGPVVSGGYWPQQVAGPSTYVPSQDMTGMMGAMMPIIMMVMMMSIMMPMMKGVTGETTK